jgi:hypothetical protein
MNVNIRRLEHQKKETKLVGLSIQVNAIEKQIKSAESRALLRCPEYNKDNIYWQRVDALMQQETNCVLMINKYNNDSLMETQTSEVPTTTPINEILNQSSPMKSKRSFIEVDGSDDEVQGFDINDDTNFDDDNVGLIDNYNRKSKKGRKGVKDKNKTNNSNDKGYKVKKEKIAKATSKSPNSGVSTRRSRRSSRT